MRISVFDSTRRPVSVRRGRSHQVALDFTMQRQLQENWCWAAVSASVSNYYTDSPWTQCEIASAEMETESCCQNGNSEECNQTWFLENALRRVGHFNGMVNRSISEHQLQRELNAGRVVGIRIAWIGGGAHFIAVDGYDASTPGGMVRVQDPMYGTSFYMIFNLVGSYHGSGHWTSTYFTQH